MHVNRQMRAKVCAVLIVAFLGIDILASGFSGFVPANLQLSRHLAVIIFFEKFIIFRTPANIYHYLRKIYHNMKLFRGLSPLLAPKSEGKSGKSG